MICCLNIFRVFFALALKHCFNIYPDVSTARNAMRISVSVSVSTTHVGRCMLALTAIYINIRALGLRRFFLFFSVFFLFFMLLPLLTAQSESFRR